MKPSSREIIAKQIRTMRLQKNLSQEELADLCGVHRTYIGTIERAESSVTVDTLDKIATALRIEPWELLKIS